MRLCVGVRACVRSLRSVWQISGWFWYVRFQFPNIVSTKECINTHTYTQIFEYCCFWRAHNLLLVLWVRLFFSDFLLLFSHSLIHLLTFSLNEITSDFFFRLHSHSWISKCVISLFIFIFILLILILMCKHNGIPNLAR